MYASPVGTTWRALQLRAPQMMSLRFVMVGAVNAVLWTGYGMLKHDPWVSTRPSHAAQPKLHGIPLLSKEAAWASVQGSPMLISCTYAGVCAERAGLVHRTDAGRGVRALDVLRKRRALLQTAHRPEPASATR